VTCTQSITSARRYYLLKRQEAAALCDKGLELVWRGKQESESGTDLPPGFVSSDIHTRLVNAGYVAREDLIGADVEELAEAGFTAKEAEKILAELAELLAS